MGSWTGNRHFRSDQARPQPTLQTPRLRLRPFDLSDAADVQRLAGDRAIADTTLNIPHPYLEGAAEKWILTHRPRWQTGAAADFAVTVLDSNELVGTVGLVVKRRFERAELGYWIARPHWGRGFCTEAARAVIEFGFTQLGLNRIHACHFARNPASGRVMQKLGMRHEGLCPQHVKKWGCYEDMVLYGILERDWLRQREAPCG